MLFYLLTTLPPAQKTAPVIAITKDNMAIKSSVRIKPGTYTVADADGNGVLRIQADNVVIDFQGARLQGSKSAEQDTYKGIGVDLNGRKNVTIKNAKVNGYMFNIRASSCTNLKVDSSDLSRSYGQRISRNGQPVDEWLVLRDVAAWRGYGAGLWLEKCTGAKITKVKACSAQNGIVLVDSNKNVIHNNDASFNSGWGIALYGSSDNTVTWNLADWVNRPWAGGWGGDSAGIVVVNGSHRNAIVANSITHGGDGFFLTNRTDAGFDRATQKLNIEGPSNDNVIAQNDGSWSPNNAFEGTFSSGNYYIGNKANDSRYGFWLGFSTRTLVVENEILNNAVDGVAIEQGSFNLVRLNTLIGNKEVGVHLWGGTAPHLASHPSINNGVSVNVIENSRLAMSFEGSKETHIQKNVLKDAPMPENFVNARATEFERMRFQATDQYTLMDKLMKTKPAGFKMYREREYPQGAEWLRVDDFAPHDFRNDFLVWRQINDYTITLYRMMEAEPEYSFQMPEWVKLTKAELGSREYVAQALEPVDGVGRIEPAGIIVSRGARSERINPTLMSSLWEIRWYKWDKDALPLENTTSWDVMFSSPALAVTKQRLVGGNFSFKDPAPGVPHQYFAFDARTRLRLPAGKYRIAALPDDGLRVAVDGQEVISAWRPTPGHQRATVDLTEGVHDFRVRFMQTWGHSYLNFSIQRMP